MHRSRLEAIYIDCSEETFEQGVRFWSGALGLPIERSDDPDSPYAALKGHKGGLRIGLQRVNDTSRIHLDIHTDDVEAEVRRLEALGATRHAQIETWWVMRDPAGHLFCVVPQGSEGIPDDATVWDE